MPHVPVLLKEVIDGLVLSPGQAVLDATVGNAGHSRLIVKQIGSEGRLIGLDLDANALEQARKNLVDFTGRLDLVQANFSDLNQVLAKLKVGQIDRALFDLGLRSDQIEASGRGFSFLRDEPLLMTLANQPALGSLTAYEIVNSWPLDRLAQTIRDYGEESRANQIAEVIVAARRKNKIGTTRELVKAIESVVRPTGRIHPATKTFQALRIAVNDELTNLEKGLQSAWDHLAPAGRLLVITFHSLEAKIVKKFYKSKVIKPTRAEILNNPRARSAQLRIIIKETL